MQPENLPTEVFVQIFKLIYKKSLYSCLFVCKRWNEIAIRIFYEKLDLTGKNIEKLHSVLLINSQHQVLKWGPFVNELRISYDEYEGSRFFATTSLKDKHEEGIQKLSQNEFLMLISNMINVKKIDLSGSIYFEYYIKLLRQVNNLRQLAEISKDSHSLNHSEYLLTCYHFRKTLTHLSLYYYESNHTIKNVNRVNILPEFEQLTSLTFENNRDKRLTLFDILTICPNLKSLVYINNFQVPDEYINESLIKFTRQNKVKNHRLQKLVIHHPSFTASYIKYITKYSPVSLETIKIYLMDIDLFDWFEEEGMENILDLGRRMSLVKNSHIYTNPEYIKRKDQDADTDVETKMTYFYSLINALKGNRPLYCSCTYSELKSSENIISITDNKYLRFQYGINHENFPPNTDINSEEWLADPFHDLILPNLHVSKIGLEIINSFTFYILQDQLQQIPIALLKYAFDNCPHLSFLEIDCMNAKLEFATGVIYRGYNQHSGSGKAIHENLTRIRFNGCVGITDEMAFTLSTYLPNIEGIMINKGYLNKWHHQDRIKKCHVIDLTPFPHLKNFCYEINQVVELDNEKVFMEFLSNDDPTKDSCYEVIKDKKNMYAVKETAMMLNRQEYAENTSIITVKSNHVLDKIVVYNHYRLLFRLQMGKLAPLIKGYVDCHTFLDEENEDYVHIFDDN
ncbi:uncharacterized protein BX663DRAFT_509554 [Cokeromyces recurvatus]|uniref:uncharacterized protein n=1 Tax=Cokeromyces recurvatus TaxID=90255 RepID=UPI00221E94E9|nr:uncharacterized protein BX663DRAFT_509554 [Cokeromyces recurvatus]KAI7903100.1 hypothetical protein BX663DRAFT_509554 [Cokeromyces recurvatus]